MSNSSLKYITSWLPGVFSYVFAAFWQEQIRFPNQQTQRLCYDPFQLSLCLSSTGSDWCLQIVVFFLFYNIQWEHGNSFNGILPNKWWNLILNASLLWCFHLSSSNFSFVLLSFFQLNSTRKCNSMTFPCRFQTHPHSHTLAHFKTTHTHTHKLILWWPYIYHFSWDADAYTTSMVPNTVAVRISLNCPLLLSL